MQLEHLAVEVRNRNFGRVGVIAHQYLDLQFTARFCDVGEWDITIPHSHPMSAELGKPGSGIIVLYRGECILSGPMVSAEVLDSTDGVAVMQAEGVCDNINFADRLIRPPTNQDSWVPPALTPYGLMTWTTMLTMGPNPTMGTTHPYLRVEDDTLDPAWSTGNVQNYSQRWGSLLDVSLAMRERGNEGWLIQQDETQDGIVYRRLNIIDTQGQVRFDNRYRGGVESTGAKVAAPGITRAIVAGEGHLKYRVIKTVSPTDTGLEALWGHRRIEQFIDQRGTVADAALTQAGEEALADMGARTQVAQNIELTEDTRFEYGVDFTLGSFVKIIDGGEELEAKIMELACMVNSSGIRVGIKVGGADVNQDRIERRVSHLERQEYTGAGPWRDLATTGAWTVFPFRQPQYRVSNGEVIFRGGIKGGAFGNAVLLPPDIIPDRNNEMLVPAGSGGARLTVAGQGTGSPYCLNVDSYMSGGDNTYVSLLGVRYFLS